jgi:hypothetical protein
VDTGILPDQNPIDVNKGIVVRAELKFDVFRRGQRKTPWKNAVSKKLALLVPVLLGANILLAKGSQMVPLPVSTIALLRAGLHHVISWVVGLTSEIPNGLLATGKPFGPRALPAPRLEYPSPRNREDRNYCTLQNTSLKASP